MQQLVEAFGEAVERRAVDPAAELFERAPIHADRRALEPAEDLVGGVEARRQRRDKGHVRAAPRLEQALDLEPGHPIPAPAIDPRVRQLLLEVNNHFLGRAADLALAQRLAAQLDQRYEGRMREAAWAAAAAVEHALGATEAATVAQLAASAMLPEQGDVKAAREFEARWQARRLLWRTNSMPRLPDMLVRLDLAESAGALPRSGAALLRFDALRARIHADEDARLDLILEFGEALYLFELGR